MIAYSILLAFGLACPVVPGFRVERGKEFGACCLSNCG